MADTLHQFTETILGITPRDVSILGGMPRMGGVWAGTQGAMGPGGGNLLYHLKRQTAAFRQAYVQADADTYSRIAQDIEGLLLMAQTLSILSDTETTALLDQLHTLTEEGDTHGTQHHRS